MWTLLSTGYGPVKALVGGLDDASRAALQADVVAEFERHRGNGSIHLPRRALLTIGTRHERSDAGPLAVGPDRAS